MDKATTADVKYHQSKNSLIANSKVRSKNDAETPVVMYLRTNLFFLRISGMIKSINRKDLAKSSCYIVPVILPLNKFRAVVRDLHIKFAVVDERQYLRSDIFRISNFTEKARLGIREEVRYSANIGGDHR